MADAKDIMYFGENDAKKLMLLINAELAKYSKTEDTTVIWSQIQPSGTKIATIQIGTSTPIDIYAPDKVDMDSAMSDTSENGVQNKVVKAYIDSKVTSAYKPKGSVVFENLPTTNLEAGDVYNITNDFTTDARFVEGAGKKYPAGTNIAYTVDNKWDVMAGFIDLSSYVLKSEIKEISADDVELWWNQIFS